MDSEAATLLIGNPEPSPYLLTAERLQVLDMVSGARVLCASSGVVAAAGSLLLLPKASNRSGLMHEPACEA